jgi:hypothetical protein
MFNTIRFGYEYIDTEFAISSSRTLYFLQARPVVAVIDDISVVDPKHVRKREKNGE